MSKELLEKKMKEIIQIAGNSLTKSEFLASFKKVIEFIREMEKNLNLKVDKKTQKANDELQSFINDLNELKQTYLKAVEKVENEAEKIVEDNKSTMSNMKKWAFERISSLFLKNKINEKLESVLNEVEEKLETINEYELPDASTVAAQAAEMAKDGLLPLIPIVEKLEEKLPQMGVNIKEALEKLKENERLDASAIKGLEDLIKELRDEIIGLNQKVIMVGGGSGGGGHIVKSHDLSPDLDGSTKTFNLPAFYRIISITSSSFPITFRETTDYTSDANKMQITFTSEVTATEMLAAGQTITILYSE